MIRSPLARATAAVTLAAGLSLSAAVPALANQDEQPETVEAEATKELSEGEKRLAKLLEGRVAGKPQTCIRALPTGRQMTIDKTAYVYGRGNTIYVQRTRNPERISDRDTLVTQRFGGTSQICRQDITTTVDPLTGILTGAVFFEDFVPYTRVSEDKADG